MHQVYGPSPPALNFSMTYFLMPHSPWWKFSILVEADECK